MTKNDQVCTRAKAGHTVTLNEVTRSTVVQEISYPWLYKDKKKGKSAYGPSGPRQAGANPVIAWSDSGYFYSPLDPILVHRKVTPSVKFARTHLYTCMGGKRNCESKSVLPENTSTMFPARARTRAPLSWDERIKSPHLPDCI